MLTLLYHRVHPKFGVHPDKFRKQMEFLRKRFKVLSLEEARKGSSPPSVLITFDDGFYDVFHYAYPILKELSLPAVIFVSPERLLNSKRVRRTHEPSNLSTYDAFKSSFLKGDNSAFLTWGELEEMMDVFSVQSHALTHRAAIGEGGKPFKGEGRDWRIFSLPEEEQAKVKIGTPLTSILVKDGKEAKRELLLSKELIEKNLGEKVSSIAFPWGIYSKELLEIAKKVGYSHAFTTQRGWNGRRLPFKVKRLAVGENKSLRWFKIRSLLYSI